MKHDFKTGQLHHLAVLTDREVKAIRKKYATGKYSQSEIAREYFVSRDMIHRIVRGKNWKHIK